MLLDSYSNVIYEVLYAGVILGSGIPVGDCGGGPDDIESPIGTYCCIILVIQ